MGLEFAPGMRVMIRDEEWMIGKVETNEMGRKVLHCRGVSTLVKDRESIFLTDIEQSIIPVDPAKVRLVPDRSAHFLDTKLYLESQWRQQKPTDDKIHIGQKAVMDTMKYQLEPARRALRQPRQRILIADTVGLGKTLEAGILMSELIRRGKGRRILVVTVKSMMMQFQKEMWNRFTIPLVRLDSSRIQKIRAVLPANQNPFYYYEKAIVSVDTLKRDVEYRTHLEKAYWDIIVIDEAQNVADRGQHQAQRARLAELLSKQSDALIMLSATPHDGRPKSFASLMNMLDPTAIADPENYTKDDIKGLCIRRFKKDVKDEMVIHVPERHFEIRKCKASPMEEAIFDEFSALRLEMDTDSSKGNKGMLFKTSLEKSLFSSPAACIKSIEARLKKLNKKYPNGNFKDIPALESLCNALKQLNENESEFSRYQELLKLLRNRDYAWKPKHKDDRLVIFTERIETMKWLADHLREHLQMEYKLSSEAVQEISGQLSDEDQQKIIEAFGREKSPIRVLVASDVASEGLNLHYLSHRLIHFDIPWSLMVFQQRNGRIDRYGQTVKPDIRCLKIESKNERIHGDMRILEILTTKEEAARDNIGDPASLMGKYNQEEEEQQVGQWFENSLDSTSIDSAVDSMTEEASAFDILQGLLDEDEEADYADKAEKAIAEVQKTIYSDKEYLLKAIPRITKETPASVHRMESVSGLEIQVTSVIERRLNALLPEEALPQKGLLRLSDDAEFCMEQMKSSMQNDLEENAWPQTQYLWPLHPIFRWVDDRCGLIFHRNEAPIIGVDNLSMQKTIFIMSGSIPNQKSTSLIDSFFGLQYCEGDFLPLTMKEVMAITDLCEDKLPNRDSLTAEQIQSAEQLLPKVVQAARAQLEKDYQVYKGKLDPILDDEIAKLDNLHKKHQDYQMELFQNDKRQRESGLRQVDDLFDEFTKWFQETMTIEDNPYIRVLAVVTGVDV